MKIEVDTRSAVPPYEQIRVQITRLVTVGALQPGARLPTIRQLAKDLRIANNTVGRAYRELENDGLLVIQGKRGTFITGEATKDSHKALAKDRRQALAQAATEYSATVHTLGYDVTDAVAAVREAMTITGQ